MEATATASLTSDRSLFGTTLDDLIAFRQSQTVAQSEECGGCGRSFPTLGDVFSHDCDESALPRTMVDPIMGEYTIWPSGRREVATVRRHDGEARQLTPVMATDRPAVPAPADDRPIDPAKVEAWLLGLGRKVEDSDVTSRVNRAAAEWVLRENLAGRLRNEFMASMHDRAFKNRPLSAGQARGLLNIWRAGLTQAQTSTTAAPAVATPAVVVPEGCYAYTTEAGHTGFAKVDHGTGNWAGRVFVRLLVGSAGNLREERTSKTAADAILAKIAADPAAASVRFGHEIGRCGRCNSPLTNESSRAAGIGPECAKKGW